MTDLVENKVLHFLIYHGKLAFLSFEQDMQWVFMKILSLL